MKWIRPYLFPPDLVFGCVCVCPDSSSLWISALLPAQPSAHFLKTAPRRPDYSTHDYISISPAARSNAALGACPKVPRCDRRYKSWHLKIIMRSGHWLEPELGADVVTGWFHSVSSVCVLSDKHTSSLLSHRRRRTDWTWCRWVQTPRAAEP